jgi:hypothetical protein
VLNDFLAEQRLPGKRAFRAVVSIRLVGVEAGTDKSECLCYPLLFRASVHSRCLSAL